LTHSASKFTSVSQLDTATPACSHYCHSKHYDILSTVKQSTQSKKITTLLFFKPE